jgi:hypothetical protein
MVLAKRPHFTESDGISPEAWNFGFWFQDAIHYYAGGEHVSRYEADRSVMENTDP